MKKNCLQFDFSIGRNNHSEVFWNKFSGMTKKPGGEMLLLSRATAIKKVSDVSVDFESAY